MDKNIYLNCGIYNYNGNDLLFIAVKSYFASNAWCISDDAYNQISGTKFEAITSDDCKSWNLNRSLIRRLNENDNINNLLSNSCKEFQNLFKEYFKLN